MPPLLIKDISAWSTSEVTNMGKMFYGASVFNQNLGNWSTTAVTNFNQMFDASDALTDTNKGLIHKSFSSNSNWPYNWSNYTDEHNQTTDGNYSVPSDDDQTPDSGTSPINEQNETITEEQLPPIVQTLHAQSKSDGTPLLYGQVMTDGGSEVFEAGFLLSKSILLLNPIRLVANPEANKTQFSVPVGNLTTDSTYYFRAFAVNSAGEARGALKKFKSQKLVDLNNWQKDAIELSGGWKKLSWFGTYLDSGRQWIYHTEMGWLYPSQMQDGSLWLWNETNGWQWTQQGVYPYLFRWRDSTWVYFQGKFEGRTVLFNYSTQSFE